VIFLAHSPIACEHACEEHGRHRLARRDGIGCDVDSGDVSIRSSLRAPGACQNSSPGPGSAGVGAQDWRCEQELSHREPLGHASSVSARPAAELGRTSRRKTRSRRAKASLLEGVCVDEHLLRMI
jgi:hypothetical protein